MKIRVNRLKFIEKLEEKLVEVREWEHDFVQGQMTDFEKCKSEAQAEILRVKAKLRDLSKELETATYDKNFYSGVSGFDVVWNPRKFTQQTKLENLVEELKLSVDEVIEIDSYFLNETLRLEKNTEDIPF